MKHVVVKRLASRPVAIQSLAEFASRKYEPVVVEYIVHVMVSHKVPSRAGVTETSAIWGGWA